MSILTIKITKLLDLVLLSQSYIRGDIKLNISRLAKELNCDRKTIRRYLKGDIPKKTRSRSKYLDEYKDIMTRYLNDFNRHFEYIDHFYYFMKREHGITCARSTFNRYIRSTTELDKLFKTNKTNTFTVRFETLKGQQAQFDLKEKVKLIDKSGATTTVYIPTLTLSWSRFNYRSLILENTTENLLVFLAQAFEEIGGVPKELVIDNLKQFVEKARNKKGDDAILNSKFEEFCKDYGITPRPCMPRRPQTKGKTETQNKTVDQLKNYNGEYNGVLDMHEKLDVINKEDNERISQATRLPRIFLLEKEKGELLLLPAKEIRSKYHLKLKEVYVTPDSLIQYKYNKYSLPKEYIGKQVGVVIRGNKLLIYYNEKIIESHLISDQKLNIKEEHKLFYEKKSCINANKKPTLKEMENIVYDND